MKKFILLFALLLAGCEPCDRPQIIYQVDPADKEKASLLYKETYERALMAGRGQYAEQDARYAVDNVYRCAYAIHSDGTMVKIEKE